MNLIKAIQKTVKTIFDIELTESQAQVFEYIRNRKYKRVQIMTTTQWGKSLTTALAVLFTAKVNKTKVAILAPTDEQSKIIMRYLLQYLECDEYFKKGLIDLDTIEKLKTERTKGSLVWADGTSIRVFTVNATSTAGVQAKSIMGFGAELVVVDEANLIPNAHFNKIFRMLGGDVENSRLIKIGNPFSKWDGEKQHHFYQSWNNDDYTKILIDYQQAIKEGRLTAEFVEEARKLMSENDFKALYEVQFPDNNGEQMVFDEKQIDQLLQAQFEVKNGVIVAGVDVSGAGKDKTVVTFARVAEATEVYKQIEIDGTSIAEKSDVIHNLLKAEKVAVVSVDVVGIGKGLSDNLVAKYDRLYNVKEYIAGASPENMLYANCKSEMVYTLQSLMNKKMIRVCDDFPIATLRKEMLQLRERVLADRRKKTDDPASSPDHLDSLLACIYASIGCQPYKIDFF